MHLEVATCLEERFGYRSLRPGQEAVIGRVLAGVNTLAVLPTGGGKSLCYQLPALCLGGLSIVVTPLIALMRDQVDGLVRRGISAERLDSSSTDEDRERIVRRLESNDLTLLYLSPERLADASMLRLLKAQSISLVAIDEAHCISEWGHSFRPSYIKLPKVVRSLKPQVVLALTATASKETAMGIRKAFGILKRDQVQTSFYRSNLIFDVCVAEDEDKKASLLDMVRGEGQTPAIVYATRRGDVEGLAAFLNESGISAKAYHAGMPAEVRGEVQDGFVAHQFQVVCATIAFGMGVDMHDVRSVIHYHPPKSPEGWIQESGRSGRDGKTSHCRLLLNGDDRQSLESMVMARQPSAEAVSAVLNHVFSQGKRALVSRYNLSTVYDFPVELLDVMFARLETGGWIVPDGGSWMWCHIVPLRWDSSARQRMLQGFSKKDQQQLVELIDSKQRVSLLELAGYQVVKMNRLIKLLREMESAGDVRLELSHSLVHYRIKREPEQLSELVDQMAKAFREHADSDMDRIGAVFKMAMSKKCIPVSLVGYFGERLEVPCGRCASCVGKSRPRVLPISEPEELSMDELELIQALIRERRPALSSPRRLARFLCGIHSPAMMRYRLYKHKNWGVLERLPYEDVLAYVEAQLR